MLVNSCMFSMQLTGAIVCAEFSSAVCQETWHVADGRMSISGQSDAVKEAMKLDWKRQEEMTDAMGNTVKIKAPKKKLR